MAIDKSKMSDKQIEAGFAGGNAKSIQQIANMLKKQNEDAEKAKTGAERLGKLDELIKSSKLTDFAQRDVLNNLKDEFIASQERLQKAIEDGDEKLIALEEKNQEKIGSASSDLEKSREAEKATKKQSNLLESIKNGISGLGAKAKDNIGVLGALGGAALAVFDPVKLEKALDSVTDTISATIKILEQIITGDFTGALDTFKESWKGVSTAIGGLALYKFGLPIKTIKKSMDKFKGSWGKISKLLKFGRAAGPIGLAITALLTFIEATTETFKEIKKKFELKGDAYTKTEMFRDIAVELPTQIAGLLTNFLKDIFTWTGKQLGFETEKLEEYDTRTDIRKFFSLIIDQHIQMLTDVSNSTKSAFDTFRAELKKTAPRLKALKENIQSIYNTVLNETILAVTTVKETIQEYWEAAKTFGSDTIQAVKDKMDAAWSAIMNGIQLAIDFTNTQITNAWSKTKEKYIAIQEKVTSIFDLIKNKIMGALDYVKDLITKAGDIKDQTIDKIKNTATNVVTGTKNIIASNPSLLAGPVAGPGLMVQEVIDREKNKVTTSTTGDNLEQLNLDGKAISGDSTGGPLKPELIINNVDNSSNTSNALFPNGSARKTFGFGNNGLDNQSAFQ